MEMMWKVVFIILLSRIQWSAEGLTVLNCASDEFECESKSDCIPDTAYCDGEVDCPDGSDENECRNCLSSQFQCKSGVIRCIPKEFYCDQQEDCGDGSDEIECNATIPCAGFLCDNYDCILESQLCDGNQDCTDGSDEYFCFQNDPCENETCSQNCKSTSRGIQCYCNDGYTLDTKDNKTCNDIDECLQDGFCSHHCINTVGSYKCSCHDGYDLVNRTCLAAGDEPILIYSTLKEIRGISLRSNKFFIYATPMSHVTAVDVDSKSQLIYWIDVAKKSIFKGKMDGSNFSSMLSNDFLVPEDIAVDYITNNLYITDSGLRQVLACKADGKMCHVLHANVEKPRAIVLDPDNRLMYWSDWGEQSPGIYRSGMDGSHPISMISNAIAWPNGIALDHSTKRLFWADAKLKTLEFITLDGTLRKVLLKSTTFHPYSLTVFEDTIYWSDWSTFSLESCNKFTGHSTTILAGEGDLKIMGVHVYHPVLTSKVSNPCSSNDCSHMCLMSPMKGFSCACPHGFGLSTDEKTCEMCDEFICSVTSRCLPWSRVCDGIDDCQMSDEGGLCSTSCAGGRDNCSHHCQKTPQGSKCSCDKGFRLLPDNKTCEDINECQELDSCSHYCVNEKGSYKCSCADGYRLNDDNHSCVAEGGSATLMYLLKDVIRGLDMETYSSNFQLIIKGANMKGFDFDVTEKVVYWTDLNQESIERYSTNNNSYDVVYRSCSRPVAVRYDWLARNLYFLDGKSNIGVCSKNGKICKTLIKSGARRIDSMTISPPSGYIFWTSWASSFQQNLSGVVRRAEMNGSHVLNIVSDVLAPTAITVDPVLEVIYWADMKLKTLECANFHGFERKLIVESGVHHPVASVVFEDHVYWVDWGTNSVIRCHKFIKGRCENVTEGNVKAHDLLVAHKVMQPRGNLSTCLVENGGCSHLCLTAKTGITCACPDHMIINVDDRTCLARECEENEFRCEDGLCISAEFRCDGSRQCNDGSDEVNCGSTCAIRQFDCGNGECIAEIWHCDGYNDCGNFNDEKDCEYLKENHCYSSQFQCKSADNHCIPEKWHCDGDQDCVDGSDEVDCGDLCEKANCSQICKNTPSGPQCSCNEGYALNSKDNKTCDDIDECLQEGFCSHDCSNTVGGFKCGCHEGYELVNRTCMAAGADPLLIYSNGKEVRGIRLRSNQFFPVVTAVSRISAVDIDPKSQSVYWIDVSNRSTIYSSNTDGSGLRSVLRHGLLVPEDIAVDYITSNLYITDSGLRQVLACKTDGSMCYVLHSNVEKPRSIALDLDNGLMYWSDWGDNSPGIFRSGMDGFHRISMVSDRIEWPNGIALDSTTNRLYWADAKLKTIEFITLDRNLRTVLLNTTVFHPYSLTLFEDTLYWSDLETFSLESCNKFTGHKVTILARQSVHKIMGVHVYHPVLISKVSNPCWLNDCSHICLMSPVKRYRCACPYGFVLSIDDKTCIKEQGESIFVSEGSDVFDIIPKMVGSESVTKLPLALGDAMITRIAYDSQLRYMFVADAKRPAIYGINMTSFHMKELVVTDIAYPGDLSFDWRSKNLYWIDRDKGTVEAVNTNLQRRVVILSHLSLPLAIAVSPAEGYMFIATLSNRDSLSMYDMDGKNQRILHSVRGLPLSLALHPSKSILYWADPAKETMSYVNYTSSGTPQIVKKKLTGIESISVSEEYIFWTGAKSELNKIKEDLTYVLQLPGQEKEEVYRKVTYSAGVMAAGKSMCLISNGGCSYVCLTSPAGRTCACSSEMILSADNVTCVGKFRATKIMAKECDANDFRCFNGQCLPAEKKCDGSLDCSDGSDEVGCRCDEFSCSATGRCLPWSVVCDGNEDCKNMSDEGGLCSMSCAGGKGNCSHSCQKTPQGSKCFCDKGFRLLPDNKTCEDINECQTLNACSHYCSNRKGSYKCSCAHGYRLNDDNHSCIAEGESATLMYILKDAIRGLDLETYSYKFQLIVKGANMRGFDFDVTEKVFYWTDLNQESIDSYSADNSHDVIYQSCSRPIAVRYDWLARNLYFLDGKSNIGVCSKNGKICKTLIKSGARRIDSMTISPPSGYMFWTSWASSFRHHFSGVIRRAEMNGYHVLNIVSSDVLAPTAITVDPVHEVVYWADMKLNTLECANFHGFNRKLIVESGVHHPVASLVFEDHVYWVDWGTNSIMRCHKFFKGRCENVTDGNVKAHDLLVAHKVMQPKRNSSNCLAENGGCSHLCLTAHKGTTCSCSDSMKLDADGRTCLVQKCDENEFRCEDGLCIRVDLRCDGNKECNDGSDEVNCGS